MNSAVEWLENRTYVSRQWRAMYFGTVGAVAGFLGSLAMIAADVGAARILGKSPFMMLRVYDTLKEGAGALSLSNWTFFLNAFVMHLAVGSALGAIFALIVSGRKPFQTAEHYVSAGVAFGLSIWIINFYLLLSWIQPLINGREYILSNIPWWVAAATHALYGLTIAVVCYPFRNDVSQEKPLRRRGIPIF